MEATISIGIRLPWEAEAATMPRVSTIQPTDEDLLSRVAQGDRDAFGDLYRRYARAVLGLALRRLGDRGRAEDAVQEAFASIWRAARSYRRDRGPVAPWLYAVARNAIVDRIRGQARAATRVPADPVSDAGPEERAETGWVAWQVHRAFMELPETERVVLELAYWAGLSQSQIAEFLGIPLGTVKTRTRSGLSRMADLLDEEDVR
jgi:RNA polymerase sigma-70 factor (ECF subfamily)